jgi:sterol desaturase/sphingolipid hydroxylase (fatty acid hydroxylase superfamily)
MKIEVAIIFIFAGFALLEAWRGKLLRREGEVSDDGRVEAISTLLVIAVTQPAIIFTVGYIMGLVVPEYRNSLVGTAVVYQVLLLLVFDDMMQYWWHRMSHTFIPLYKLHRAHHNGKYMSIRIVYRNNVFYYAMMPSLWLSGAMIYLGFGEVYAVYLVVKMTVIFGAHSEWKWDRILYDRPWLNPLAWVIERTISTPATHSAHHGLDPSDGITTYKGNYGNLLFFWDVLFGTAQINRKYPERYGVSGMLRADWKEQLIWPLYTTPRKPKAPSKDGAMKTSSK